MADTGYNWSAWADMTYLAGTDVDDIALANGAALITDEVDLDLKAACEISAKLIEDNTGAVASPWVLIQILRESGEEYQLAATPGPVILDRALSLVMVPVQNATRLQVFPVDPKDMGKFKINVVNDCGQELALTLRIRTATIPVAS